MQTQAVKSLTVAMWPRPEESLYGLGAVRSD
jgi:hypothetical protein